MTSKYLERPLRTQEQAKADMRPEWEIQVDAKWGGLEENIIAKIGEDTLYQLTKEEETK